MIQHQPDIHQDAAVHAPTDRGETVLVTGASGFLGRALKARLLADGYRVLEMNSNADITEADNYTKFFDAGLSHVFHLAGRLFAPESWTDPAGFMHTNVLGTERVLEFCRMNRLSLTYVSGYVYGVPEKLPIAESDHLMPNNPYALSKYLAERLCEFYAREYGVKTHVLRPFNVYGPNQNEKFLIPHIMRQVASGQDVRVLSLIPRRDFIYVDDVVDATVKAFHHTNGTYAVYNIGSGISLSVEEVIDEIQRVAGVSLPVVSEEKERTNEISDTYADISRARKDLAWSPVVSFAEGIRTMWEDAGYGGMRG
jgi:nucleoside-diphosphate-sugar epimerase